MENIVGFIYITLTFMSSESLLGNISNFKGFKFKLHIFKVFRSASKLMVYVISTFPHDKFRFTQLA